MRKMLCFRSVTIAYPGSRKPTADISISWHWLSENWDINGFLSNPTDSAPKFHTSELEPGNFSQFPTEYVLLSDYTEGRYLLFYQKSGQSLPLSIGDVVPNFAEMRKLVT